MLLKEKEEKEIKNRCIEQHGNGIQLRWILEEY
jgi:hypothetical protein